MNTDKKHIGKKEVILHSLFWLAWIVSFTFIQTLSEGMDSLGMWLCYYIVTLPVFVAHTYLIAYWLVPLTFFKGRYLLLVIGIFLLLIFFSIIELLLSKYMVFYWFDNYRMHTPNFLSVKNILISGVGNHYIILVFLAIKAGASWYGVETKKDELLRSKDETELEIYQYQLQPKLVHTLVEELETVSTQKPGKTSEMIIRISEFLNDFLYEGKEDLIPLQLEVELLNNFMEIHKQALGDRIKSNFIVAGNLKSVVIPPLLLLPFINSAIKIAYECNKIFESTVLIKVEKKYLLFSFSFWSDDEFGIDDDENIRITRKRLKYSFPGKYRLIENIDSNFREFSLEIFS